MREKVSSKEQHREFKKVDQQSLTLNKNMLNITLGAPAISTVPVASMGSTTNTRDPSGNLSGNLKKWF